MNKAYFIVLIMQIIIAYIIQTLTNGQFSIDETSIIIFVGTALAVSQKE